MIDSSFFSFFFLHFFYDSLAVLSLLEIKLIKLSMIFCENNNIIYIYLFIYLYLYHNSNIEFKLYPESYPGIPYKELNVV